MSTHRFPKSERKRFEILKSAAAVFRRRGYYGASVEEIASALNMTKGNLYYYFKNKEEILFVCHDYALDIILEHLNEVETSTDPADTKVHRLVTGFVHLFIDVLQGMAWTIDVEPLSPALRKRVIAKRDRFDAGLRRILQEGIEQGVFSASDPKLLSFAILGAINWIPRWYDPAGQASSNDIAEVFASFLVRGLRPDEVEATESVATPREPKLARSRASSRSVLNTPRRPDRSALS
jgi:AcrR family transcriptional regulator